MNHIQRITIPATDGKALICNVEGFEYIDLDFKNWGLDKVEKATTEMKFDILEITENMTFAQMFPNPEKVVMTQAQVLECEKQNTESYTQLYIIRESAGRYYVVSASKGEVRVHLIESNTMWGIQRSRRIVIPDKQPEILTSFIPHAPKIEMVKKYCKCEQCIEFIKEWNESK